MDKIKIKMFVRRKTLSLIIIALLLANIVILISVVGTLSGLEKGLTVTAFTQEGEPYEITISQAFSTGYVMQKELAETIVKAIFIGLTNEEYRAKILAQ